MLGPVGRIFYQIVRRTTIISPVIRVSVYPFPKLSAVSCNARWSSSVKLDEEEATRGTATTMGEDPLQNGNEGAGAIQPLEEEVQFTLQISNEDIQELTGGDEELMKKVKYIQLEHEVYRQEGLRVPSSINMRNWKELLQLGSPNSRKKYYSFLFLNEMKKLSDKKKKLEKREERMKEEMADDWLSPEEDVNGIMYGLNRNTLFLRLYDTTVAKFEHGKVIQAMRFGRPLVLDCGYDEFMSPRESKNCAKQLEILISNNRSHSQPFDLRLCNAKKDSRLMEYLLRIIPTLYDATFPIHIHEESYLDIFPRKELVYLTPHAQEELDEYKEDDIYIVGIMVDKSDPRPFSLAKAKREKLKIKKLPLDKHLVWGIGNKSLTINQMGDIMLDLRLTGDWKKALDHVPKRKLNRQFHPYPNQIAEGQQPRENFQPFLRRHEKKSQVMEDFELISRRKGFKGYDSSNGRVFNERYEKRSGDRYDHKPYQSISNSNSTPRVNARSLFDD